MDAYLSEIISRLQEVFSPEIVGRGLADFITNLIVGLITFTVFYLFWVVVDRIFYRISQRTNLDMTTSSFVERTLKYVVLTIGIVEALSSAGVDTGAVLASLGIAGLTIGFAARDSLSNLISGLLIFWDRPFVIGDLIEVGGYYGRVDDITLRSTRVVTVDGTMLAVPNSVIINSTVASYTNFPNIRLDIDFTIAVTEDIDRVRGLLLSMVAQDSEIMQDPAPKVVVTALNDYNVALQLQAWLRDEKQHIVRRFDLREKVFKTLTQAGVEMPLETFQLAPFEMVQKDKK